MTESDHTTSTTIDVEKATESPALSQPVRVQQIHPWHHPSKTRNPANWSLPRKLFQTALPCCLSFTITFATATTVPATSIIAQRFDVSRTVSILALTVFTVGIAFGPVFIAPLSEFFGRKLIYAGTLSLLVVFLVGAGSSNSLATLLVLRFLAGFLGSAGVAIGAGTVMDLRGRGTAAALAAMILILGPFLGPTLGPVAGAYLLDDFDNDWRWSQWIVSIVGTPILAGFIFMRETHSGTIERTTRPQFEEVVMLIKSALIKATKMLFTEIIVASLALYTAYAYAMIFAFFASSSYVLPLYYDFTAKQVGLASLAVVIGYLLACVSFAMFERTIGGRALAESPSGVAAPEYRLNAARAGSVMIPVGLFWYAWEARRGGHWASVVAAGISFGYGTFSVCLSAITYIAHTYGPRSAASALAANDALRYTLGAVFPLFTVQMYEKLGPAWAGSVFGFLSLALLPIPWLLCQYGARLRAKDEEKN